MPFKRIRVSPEDPLGEGPLVIVFLVVSRQSKRHNKRHNVTIGVIKVETTGVAKSVRAEVVKVATIGFKTGSSTTWGPHPERLV